MHRRIIIAAGAVALALPSAATAHVTVHPNVIPEGAFTVLDLRVPNETEDKDTTKVAVELPDGFASVAADPPPGWKVAFKKTKLATPIKTDDGTVDMQIKQVTFTGGTIPPGQFVEFPLSVGLPGKAGDTLTFKALQTYSDGQVVRWIGGPDADEPAPTISVVAKDGIVEDSTAEHGAAHQDEPAAQPATTRVVEKSGGKGLSVAALILGALGLLAGGAALARSRRAGG